MKMKYFKEYKYNTKLVKFDGFKRIIPTERDEQIKLVKYLKFKKIPFYAVPNGGSRNPIEAKNMKAEGVSAGVPDICIPVPNKKYHGLYIEMKRQRGGRVSEKQKEWIDRLNQNGYLAVVCRGFDEAKEVVESYMKEI